MSALQIAEWQNVSFKPWIARVATGVPLTVYEATSAFDQLASGGATASQIGAFVMALRIRGETVDEITGAALAMRAKMRRVDAGPGAMDVVGTGGDASGSYNISTCAAFIVAGVDVPVAKHGNRALSSRCGAADVLKALGIRTDLTPDAIARCIAEAGLGFMFAPAHHPALTHVGPTRADLGTRTIFNLLGPLLNPAGVTRQLVGVYSRRWVEPLAHVLGQLGSVRAMVVHGSDGLDEITTTGPTFVAELAGGTVRMLEIRPEEAGLDRARPEQLQGGDAVYNAAALRSVLESRPSAYGDVAAFNAAAALMVAGRVESLREGMALAKSAIRSGAALDRLDRLIISSNKTNEVSCATS